MKGNFHVQFLGEGVAATSPPYPTPGWATTQVYPARISPGFPEIVAQIQARSRKATSRPRSASSWTMSCLPLPRAMT